MKVGEKLFWDQLGRSGRTQYTNKQHFNPHVAEEFEKAGCDVVILPAPGHYLNPIELLFNDLKELYIKPNHHSNGRELNKEKLETIIKDYAEDHTPAALPGFSSTRATEKKMKKLELLN